MALQKTETALKETALHGYYREEGGLVYAVSSDNRFVTSGATREEALAKMSDLLTGFLMLSVKHKFEPLRKLSEKPFPTDKAKRWELQPA